MNRFFFQHMKGTFIDSIKIRCLYEYHSDTYCCLFPHGRKTTTLELFPRSLRPVGAPFTDTKMLPVQKSPECGGDGGEELVVVVVVVEARRVFSLWATVCVRVRGGGAEAAALVAVYTRSGAMARVMFATDDGDGGGGGVCVGIGWLVMVCGDRVVVMMIVMILCVCG